MPCPRQAEAGSCLHRVPCHGSPRGRAACSSGGHWGWHRECMSLEMGCKGAFPAGEGPPPWMWETPAPGAPREWRGECVSCSGGLAERGASARRKTEHLAL